MANKSILGISFTRKPNTIESFKGARRQSPPSDATVVHQGWIYKRGEYIKSWRPRWFQLKSDGSFKGFKTGPPQAGDVQINHFEIEGSLIKTQDEGKGKTKKYGFTIRFMQMTRFEVRHFRSDTVEQRDAWIAAFQEVKAKLASVVKPNLDTTTMVSDFSEAKGRHITLDDFEMKKVLGKGTFGKVVLVKEKGTDDLFAIKILKKNVIIAKDEVVHTLTENTVLQNTRHPFLTELKYSFQTKDLLCFVMEYVNGGELFFHLSQERIFTESRTRFYGMEISLALTYLHERGIIYRDLKLENLMLDRNGHIKITDFGLCKEDIMYGTTTATFCGTPEYLAPEVLDDQEYGRAVDWWGTGVVMFEMMTGHLPFYNKDHELLFQLILHGDLSIPETLSASARDLLAGMLQKNPLDRLGGGERDGYEVLDHPFFASLDPQAVLNKQVPAPFIPRIRNEEDTSNFDSIFTDEPMQLTPPEHDHMLDEEITKAAFETFMGKSR